MQEICTKRVNEKKTEVTKPITKFRRQNTGHHGYSGKVNDET
jgi:hypothetical protein